MSQYNSAEKEHTKEPWERTLEMDYPDTDTSTIRTLESGALMTSIDYKFKEYEIQKYLDEVDKKCNKDRIEQLEECLEEARMKIQSLYEQIEELEGCLKGERKQTNNYFNTLDRLEKENDRLREENSKLNESNRSIQKKIYVYEKQIEMAKREATTRKSRKDRSVNAFTPFDKPERGQKKKVDVIREKNESIFEDSRFESGSDGEQELSRITNTSCERSRTSFFVDDLWIKKVRFLKEKFKNEQKKCKNLEFLVKTQKDLSEAANQNVMKLKVDNESLEEKNEQMKSELEKMSDLRMKEKSKIDKVITYCELLGSCSFSKDELYDKLSNFPSSISLFLKGSSDSIVLKSGNITSNGLVPSIEEKPTMLSEQLGGFDFSEGGEKEKDPVAGQVSQELDDIRTSLNSMASFLSQAFPKTDPGTLTNLETISNVHLALRESLKNDSKAILNPHLGKGEPLGLHNSKVFTKAIQNSNSLLWNLKLGVRGRGSFGHLPDVSKDKDNQENIDNNKIN